MANTFFKSFAETDRTTSRTLLHESIPITGSLVSGTYGNNENIKSFSHGMFKSVYDYPYLSSSANHLFDVSWGYVSSSAGTISTQLEGLNIVGAVTNQASKKKNMYSQMAQVLAGFGTDSNVRIFDFDGEFGQGSEIGTAVFINFSRLLVKDEIKKGSFSITMGTSSAYNTPFLDGGMTFSDTGADTNYLVNSPAGEYGLLYTGSLDATNKTNPRGLIYYQAGVVVLPASDGNLGTEDTTVWVPDGSHRDDIMKTGSMDQFADGFINRIQNISFNNTTELNSSIYFCRASHNEFNYSSNPTYVSGSKITVKANDIMMPPRSYVTTVGLYSADNELLAVAKLSEPLRKDPTSELTLRVRLDY